MPLHCTAHLHLHNNNTPYSPYPSPRSLPPLLRYLRLELLTNASEAQLDRLWQLCINAEPNYGTLWFHCKANPLLSTRQVLHTATELVAKELQEWRHVYESAINRASTPEFKQAAQEAAQAAIKSADDGQLPSLTLPPLVVLGDGPPSEPADFVTGSVGLNRMQRRCSELSPEEQRGLIYGGDTVTP